MRASISGDTGRGPGNGVIEIFDAGSVSDPGFTLLRASDGKCLGPRGWQESETLLTPDAWDNDGGSLRLAVGPAVVDEVDNLDAYRISLRGVGSCALAVKSLVYSHIAGGHGMGAATPAAGKSCNSATATCTSRGISTSTGPGRSPTAMAKASGMTRKSSSMERTIKLCLVAGMDMP